MTDDAATQLMTIPVSGGALEAEIRWAKDENIRTPLLFLHGWSLDRRMWQPQFKTFAAGRTIVAIDRRGFGRSTAPPGLDREIDDIVAVQDALSLKACVVVGMSQAGRVALEFAARYPERTAALILQGAPLEGFDPAPKPSEAIPIAEYMDLVSRGRIAEMRRRWRGHPMMKLENPAMEGFVNGMLESYDGRDLLVSAQAGVGLTDKELNRVHAPSLVITGDGDTPWRRLVGDVIAYGIPEARRATIDRAGHLCNVCAPAQYNEAVEAFLIDIGQ